MRRSAAPAIPAPIPAFAPVLRSDGEGAIVGVLLVDAAEVGLEVAVADVIELEPEEVLETVARGGAYESISDWSCELW